MTDGIDIYEKNPWYWQYEGEPVLLLGGSDADNIYQWAGEPATLLAHLDTLAACGGNYIRNTLSQRTMAFPYDDTGAVYPFKKLENGKYDLAQFDEAHWDRLRFFLDETKKRGIFVQQELWDKWAVCVGDAWSASPWNPANNVNYPADSPTFVNTEVRPQNYQPQTPAEVAHRLFAVVPELNNDARILGYQNRYIEKMLSITLAYDHVLYQLNNESEFPPEVSNYWAAFVHKQAGAGKVHLCDSRRFHPPSLFGVQFQDVENPEHVNVWANPELYTYVDISQNGGNDGDKHYENLSWYRAQQAERGVKPINHTKTYLFTWTTGNGWKDKEKGTAQQGRERFWRTIFGGAASCRHHRAGAKSGCHEWGGLGLTEEGQLQIRSMRALTAEMDIFSTEPHNDLLSDRGENVAYAMAEPGRQYAVYFTGAGNRKATLDLSDANGELALKWLDIAKSVWQDAAQVEGGDKRELAAPGEGQWVAWLDGRG